MSNVKFQRFVKIDDVANLIAEIGQHVTVVVRGEPGTGKSSILKLLQHLFGNAYHYVYIDVPNVGDGDMVMRVPDRETKNIEEYISSQFKLADGKPLVIMLDEYLKASKLLKPLFTRLILERMLGDTPLPDGSIVFATSNLASDGVGDTTQAHEGNRVCYVEMAKPTHKEWLKWAINAGISGTTRTMVDLKPSLFESYRTLTAEKLNENPFIFNPTKPEQSVTFCSPRSLQKADFIVKASHKLPPDVVAAALEGVVGKPTADMFHTFMMIGKDLMRTADIIANPDAATIPTSPAATIMLMQNAVDELETQDDILKWLKFVDRIHNREYESVFMSLICESKRMSGKAFQNKRIMEWYEKNHKVTPDSY
jgi:hypothetical protein